MISIINTKLIAPIGVIILPKLAAIVSITIMNIRLSSSSPSIPIVNGTNVINATSLVIRQSQV